MAGHRVYRSLVNAVKTGKLKEPFAVDEFRSACPGFAAGTYRNFLRKHAVGNGATTELFIKIGAKSYKFVRPFLYGF
jgi:hypothetical protein